MNTTMESSSPIDRADPVDIPVVGSSIYLGIVSLVLCMIFFSLAIHNEWIEDLAPRAANRPKVVMKNAILHNLTSVHKNKVWYYPIAWIIWAYNLTYKECIFGIPGTGTRRNGWEGPLLKTNLDAVILMKYHTLLFKISVMVAVLCLFVLLPVNVTSECDPETFGEFICTEHSSASIGFTKTTFANIPDKRFVKEANQTLSAGNIIYTINPFNNEAFDRKYFWVPDQTWRVVMTLVCCLVIYFYTFYLLTQEWMENIALRRSFFLEASHHNQRIRELSKCELRQKSDQEETKSLPRYVTHPEIRETPPSVSVYSVLYKLPNSMITYDTDGATAVERQLVATTQFFDQVVPPQPGYSSSVAAVTVIPEARLVALAWNKWSACEQKLQTLRCIRALIAAKKEEKQRKSLRKANLDKGEDGQESAKDEPNGGSVGKDNGNVVDGEICYVEAMVKTSLETCDQKTKGTTSSVQREKSKDIESVIELVDPILTQHSNGEVDLMLSTTSALPSGSDVEGQAKLYQSTKRSFRYDDFDVKEYAKLHGFCDEVEMVSDLVDGMGIEEFHVFAYNAAMMEGGPGLNKKVYKVYSVHALEEEERELIEELQEARAELLEARTNVVTLNNDDTDLQDDEHSAIFNNDSMLNSGVYNGNMDDPEWLEANEWGAAAQEIEPILPISPTFSQEHRVGFFQKILFILKRIFGGTERSAFLPKYYRGKAEHDGKAFVTNTEHPSYAVVTFTSRHAAIIARQCLADGGPTNSWRQVDDIPIHPLADAPPMMCHPRSCMRPVTPTISYTSKKIRLWVTYIFLVLFTTCYLPPINYINRKLWDSNRDVYNKAFERLGLSPSVLDKIIPTLSGLTQTLLFSICPTIFRFVADFEGSSTSMDAAEHRSMIFFWYFYIAARFMGPILWQFFSKLVGGKFESVDVLVTQSLVELARTVPKILGPSALTLIIFAGTITWPALYWLQINNFLTSTLRLGWINRLLKGGGPGAEVPYRIYIDSGYVLACMTSLAPLCPMIGPFAMLYFVVLSPMIRWLMVFGYRPRFDGGGDKWPKLHHIIVTSVLMGQVIVGISFILKGNLYEGLAVGLCIIPTLLYNSIILEKFLPPFSDASLLQTSKLYNAECSSRGLLEREEFRRWLVDCHKASYLPTCLSGGKKSLLTAEPTMVEPKAGEEDPRAETIEGMSFRRLIKRQNAQRGGILRSQKYEL